MAKKQDMFCRTCLCSITGNLDETIKSHNIFQHENFADKLMQCTDLQSYAGDEFPSSVCTKCYQQVLDFFEFRQMCHNSLEIFKNIVECEIENDIGKSMKSYDPLLEQRIINATEEVEKTESKNPLEVVDDTRSNSNVKDNTEMVAGCTEVLLLNNDKNSGEILSEPPGKNIKKQNDVSEEETSLSDESESNINTTERLFQCDLCPKTFQVKRRLESHQRKHKGLPPYLCTHENCERSFNRWHYFQEHLKQHNQRGSQQPLFKCDISSCERVYKNKSALNIHKRKCHDCGPELKSHMCEMCGKVFKSSAVLSDHRFTHVEKSQLPFVCDVEGCVKKFSNKEKLKVHKMRHAGIKNYICPHCGMRKTTRNELKIHINYHTLERTWKCHFCSKVCNSAGNLKMHVRNIHERARDFACRFCERTFAKADTRKYHEMTHTGEKPHACNECGRRFLQPAALRTHKKIHLKDKKKILQCERDAEKDKSKKTREKLEILECTTILESNQKS